MRLRALTLIALGVVGLGPLALPAAGAAIQLRIIKWEATTVHNQKKTVHSGATIRFCAADPYYGISPLFSWSGVPFGTLINLTASLPRLKASRTGEKTFEASGENGDTLSAAAYGSAAKSLPPGSYSLRVSAGGAQTSGSITLVETPHC
jgi:hypothetical protein